MINAGAVMMYSGFYGFSNFQDVSVSGTIAAQNILIGQTANTTITIPLTQTSDLSRIKIQFPQIGTTDWFQCEGYVQRSSNDTTYALQAFAYYTGTTLTILVYASNQTGGTLALAQQTINIAARLYITPF